jgi:hypothetical protein
MRSAPRLASAGCICLVEAGSVVLGDTPAASGQECDEQLRAVLVELLEHCGGDHPSLLQVARGRARSPIALAEELFAALVPMNRSAARRALCRLHKRLDAAGVPAEPSPSPARTAIPKRLVQPEVREVRSDGPEGRADVTPELPTPALPTPVLPAKVALPQVAPRTGQAQPVSSGPWLVAHTPVVPECQVRFELLNCEPTPFLGSVGVVNAAGDSEGVGAASITALNETPTLPLRPLSALPDARPALADASPAPAGAAQGLVFGRFTSRRSDVKRLLAGFSLETSAPHEGVIAELGRCIDASAGPPPRT